MRAPRVVSCLRSALLRAGRMPARPARRRPAQRPACRHDRLPAGPDSAPRRRQAGSHRALGWSGGGALYNTVILEEHAGWLRHYGGRHADHRSEGRHHPVPAVGADGAQSPPRRRQRLRGSGRALRVLRHRARRQLPDGDHAFRERRSSSARTSTSRALVDTNAPRASARRHPPLARRSDRTTGTATRWSSTSPISPARPGWRSAATSTAPTRTSSRSSR